MSDSPYLITAISVSHNGLWIATYSRGDGNLVAWNVDRDEVNKRWTGKTLEKGAQQTAIDDSGKYAAVRFLSGGECVVFVNESFESQIRDPDFLPNPENGTALTFLADGRLALVGNCSVTIYKPPFGEASKP